MRLDKQDYLRTEDQRKGFFGRFIEELQRAAVETLTPVQIQNEHDYQTEVDGIMPESGKPPGPIRDFKGNVYDSLKDYVNRYEANRHRK